jgi:hypothetical protein
MRGAEASDVAAPKAWVGLAVLYEVSYVWCELGSILGDGKHTLVVRPCTPGEDL